MPIQVLPPQLANQIAAGEVVERPASVVKELVENSLDAGATRIDIDIERGGAKLIRIRDNGSGIKKDELALALARHATSKIASLDDLEAIISLGFRGEALASISSVARLTLTSRTAEQQEAWQAYAEGRDQAVTVKPAAHPVGTTLEVLDLFYNTPARRKFLRTEKTEFNHIDEIIRRIALARFDVTINLSHNGKIVRQYRAVPEGGQKERRLGAICGTAFLEQALAIEWQHGDLTLRGWVADPNHTTPALADHCFDNSRFVPPTPSASHGVSTLHLSSPYLQYDSSGTFRNVPLLLSHACLCAGRFDAYFVLALMQAYTALSSSGVSVSAGAVASATQGATGGYVGV